jgi:amidase
MALFGQDEFERAEAGVGVNYPAYLDAKLNAYRIAGPKGIDAMLAADNLMALVAPTFGPAWLIDPVMKDHYLGGLAGQAAAVAGYPHLTVPMGQVDGLPVGLSFIGPAWSDATLLAYGFAFEQMTHDAIAPAFAARVAWKNIAGAKSAATIEDVCH